MEQDKELWKGFDGYNPDTVSRYFCIGAIVDLGAPLDYHLILGAGLYTFIYIVVRACGKYFGARIGAKKMKMPETVQKL